VPKVLCLTAQATNVLKVYQDFDMKTYNACKERAEEDAAMKIEIEATTQARWEQCPCEQDASLTSV
jgi:hypothetical protein